MSGGAGGEVVAVMVVGAAAPFWGEVLEVKGEVDVRRGGGERLFDCIDEGDKGRALMAGSGWVVADEKGGATRESVFTEVIIYVKKGGGGGVEKGVSMKNMRTIIWRHNLYKKY